MVSKGILTSYFETGCEGTYFILEDEDQDGYEGLRFIKDKDQLDIFFDGEKIWSGEILLVDTIKAKKDRYFRQYVRPYPMNPTIQQLCFAGRWVHYLPTNIDLGLWYEVFFTHPSRYTGILTRKD